MSNLALQKTKIIMTKAYPQLPHRVAIAGKIRRIRAEVAKVRISESWLQINLSEPKVYLRTQM